MRTLAFTLVVVFFWPAEAQTILPIRESTISSGSGGAGLTYPNSVFVVGNLAYVASQVSHSLDIIDISVPSSPTFIAKMETGGQVHLTGANAVFVSGNYAYVTALEEALQIIDVSDPAHPSHVSSISNHVAGAQLTLPATIFVDDGYAYVGGCTPEGSAIPWVGYFGIFDVSNPANPMPRGSLTTLVNIRSLVAVGNYVYAVQSSNNRLVVIDITDKNHPTVVGTLAHGEGGAMISNPTDIAVSGTKAYITSNGHNALEVVDITNPAAPAHLGKLSFPEAGSSIVFPYSLEVEGNYAYVTGPSSNSTGVIEVVDISNSATPVRVGTLTSSSGATFVYPVSISVNGTIASVIGQQSNSMHVVDLSNPSTPMQVGTIVKSSAGASLANVSDIECVDDVLYVATHAGIQVVDVHNSSKPVPLSFLADGTDGAKLASCTSIEISGSYAFATSAEENALEVIDISNPAQIQHVATLSDGEGGADLSAPRDLSIAGNYAYVAVWNSHSIEIIDISNPAAPVHAGNIASGDEGTMFARPMCIKISGNYAYVVGWQDNSIEILNISDPVHPHHAATISNAMSGVSLNGPGSVTIRDGYAFVADNGNSELEIFDVSNPTSPSHVSSLTFGSSIPAYSTSHAIVRAGKYCLITDYNNGGLKSIDVSNPALPFNIQIIDNISSPTTVTAIGNHAFMGNNGSVAIVALFTPPQVNVTEATDINSTSFFAHWQTVSYTPIFQTVTYGVDVSLDGFASFLPGFENFQITGGNIGLNSLQPGTEYQYRVRATNVNGTGPVSAPMTVKTGPPAPSILPAQPVTQTSFVANWGNVADVTNYLFTIGKTGGPAIVSDHLVFGSSIGVASLEPGTSYYYFVKASSSWANSSPSPQITVTTIPPDPVTTEAMEITPFSFRANWLSAAGATGYYLDVSKDDFTTFVVQDFELSATFKKIESIQPGKEYRYRVRAYNSSGVSGNSNVTTVNTMVVGIGDMTESMKLFPNPTSGVMYYEFPGASVGGARVVVTDVTGRERWSGWSASDQFVDVSALPAGLYFFIVDMGSHSLREKFIKK